MLGISGHEVSQGVISRCLVQWQGYLDSEPDCTWETVGAVCNMNSKILKDYATSLDLTLPADLDLSFSEYSSSDVFNDEEEAEPGAVVDQGASQESDSGELIASQLLEDMSRNNPAGNGKGEDEAEEAEPGTLVDQVA